MPRALPDGWLKAYGEYTKQSEAPEPFHLWTGLSVLSGVLRRRVFVNQGHYVLYPNLFVVLVAPPGTCRKSVAINIGLRLLRQVPGVNVESNKMTPQALVHTMNSGMIQIDRLSELIKEGDSDKIKEAVKQASQKIKIKPECAATLVSTEFSVMLGADAQQSGLLALLTDLYDCPDTWSSKTIGRGVEELQNVFLNVLAASTPDWLGSSIPKDAIGGGFTSRILFVAQNRKRHDNPRPKLTREEQELKKLLIQDLSHISELRGEIELSPKGEDFFDKWYRNRPKKELDERFWGYLERKHDHLLKLAAILSISFNDTLVVTDDHLEMGLTILERLEQRMPDAFKGVGGAGLKDIEQVTDFLVEEGGMISYKDLMRKMMKYVGSQDLNAVLTTMRDAGMIHELVKNGTREIILNTPKDKGSSKVQ